jgi:hypothetical protein
VAGCVGSQRAALVDAVVDVLQLREHHVTEHVADELSSRTDHARYLHSERSTRSEFVLFVA